VRESENFRGREIERESEIKFLGNKEKNYESSKEGEREFH